MPQIKKYSTDGKAARRSFAASRSSASRQSMLYRPVVGPRVSRTEVKALDTVGNTFALNTTGTVVCLNLIRTGTSFMNRVGRKISLKSLHMKLQVSPLATKAAVDYARVLIVYDAQTNGANPTWNDVIQDTDQAATNSNSTYASANLNNRDRFKILADFKLTLPSLSVAAGVVTNLGLQDPVQPLYDVERYIKLKGLPTIYKADSSPAVVGDISTGGLFILTQGAYAAGAEGYQMFGSLRLRYKDQ